VFDATVRPVAYAGVLVGVALFTAVIAYRGVGVVAAALASAGSGLLLVVLAHVPPLCAHGAGWRSLLRGEWRPGLPAFVRDRWIAESFNDLLPVLQVGGNIVRAQALARAGVAGTTAGGSVVVDITLNVVAQVLFTLAGLVLLVWRVGSGRLVLQAVIGVMAMAAVLIGFYAIQRRGLFAVLHRLLERIAHAPEWGAVASNARALDAEVDRFYGKRRALATATVCHVTGWALGALEIWVALRVLGHPLGVTASVLWESLGQAVRTAAFLVPGALGVQEGSYLLLGGLLGLPPETALAVSLARRVRELVLGIPGLVVWQVSRTGAWLTAARRDPGPPA
jgi:putative membrane protein